MSQSAKMFLAPVTGAAPWPILRNSHQAGLDRILERFGFDEAFVDKVVHIMEYEAQWKLMKQDRLVDR